MVTGFKLAPRGVFYIHMFDELSEKLANTFAKLRGRGTLSEADIKDGLREVRSVLL